MHTPHPLKLGTFVYKLDARVKFHFLSGSLSQIIDHWGEWGRVLQPWAGPGHWHDMDTILAGNGCINHDEERTQVAIWAISASPFIMGNVSSFGALPQKTST